MKTKEQPKSTPNGNRGRTPGGRPPSSRSFCGIYVPLADMPRVREILDLKPEGVSQGHVVAGIILAYGPQWLRDTYGKAVTK